MTKKEDTLRIRSTRDLRNFLTGQLEGVATGDIPPDRAKGMSNIAQQIYNSMLIELKFAKARKDIGDDAITPLQFDE